MANEKKDWFRPINDPARAIYDAFQDEAMKRSERYNPDDWIIAERQRVYEVACSQAEKKPGLLRPPTMEEVIIAEQSASGHIDYGAKWAYGVVDFMRRL